MLITSSAHIAKLLAILSVAFIPSIAQAEHSATEAADYTERAALQWRERYNHTQAPHDLLSELRVWKQLGRCDELKSRAQLYLALPNTTPQSKHEIIHASLCCAPAQVHLPKDLRSHSPLRPSLHTTRRILSIRQHAQDSITPAQLAAWTISGEGVAAAASSSLYASVDLEPRAEGDPNHIKAQNQRRFSEARKRINATHWLIPTIYSISGMVTREGLVVFDQQLNQVEARVQPVYRAGGLGARLSIRF